jgi:DNA polymerase-1
VVSLAKEKGYTETLMGRRRYIPELNGPGPLRALGKRIAMNAPIQGTAADIMKIAMIKTARRLREDAPEAKIVMQVHDELVVECPEAIAPLVKEILTEEMSDAVKLSVPLPVEVTSGKNWLEQG